jgi:hypothetical protein
MTDKSEPVEPPRPKRGAFPTPRSEIAKAPPYVPDTGEEEDCTEADPEPPAAAEDET